MHMFIQIQVLGGSLYKSCFLGEVEACILPEIVPYAVIHVVMLFSMCHKIEVFKFAS